jgi:hypothetical protein
MLAQKVPKHLMPIIVPNVRARARPSPLSHAHAPPSIEAIRGCLWVRSVYMTVQGMQQQLQSSVLMQLHFPP